MAALSISLLGSFEVGLEGHPITGFGTDKVRALLAYLAVEKGRPLRRETLAALLWPEGTERSARNSLRQALFQLRRALGDREGVPPLLLATHDTVWLDPSRYRLDSFDFQAHLEAAEAHPHDDPIGCVNCAEQLAAAVELYRGDFLEGISLGGSESLQDWALFKQEELHRRALEALRRLVEHHSSRGSFERALRYAERQIALEPWREEAHRQVIRLLAITGQRSAALRQYEACRSLLAAELGVEPTDETTGLYESLRNAGADSCQDPPPGPSGAPHPSPPANGPPRTAFEAFVGRDRELAELHRHLRAALAGRGGVVFVTGEAGSGKSTLVAEFGRQAEETRRDLVVTDARCSAFTGPADSYRPFMQIFRGLVGDAEDRGLRGASCRRQAARLRALSPVVGEALLRVGAELVGTLLPRSSVARRAEALAPAGTPQRAELEALLRRSANRGRPATVQPAELHAEAAAALRAISHRCPLILVLDDLHWADPGSLHLLADLGRELAGCRILVVGMYRAEEVTEGSDGPRHPLRPVINELRRALGEIRVDLNEADGAGFVEELLRSEPNALGEKFSRGLLHCTDGHALFTVELLRDLRERGELRLNGEGRWVASEGLRWEELPARVEAVIAERLDRLPRQWQMLLKSASVQGEEFVAGVAARVEGLDEAEAIRALSGPLFREHRLLRPSSVAWENGRRLSLYRFRHHLFQSYLYRQLDQAERALLHEATGSALEELYGSGTEARAAEMARHFEAAGLLNRAVGFLRQAAARATRLCAWEEGIAHLSQALSLLGRLPDTPERLEQELAVQLALGAMMSGDQGWGSPERAAACERAYELCRDAGADQEVRSLYLLSDLGRVRGRLRASRETGERMLALARREMAPDQLVLAHYTLGETLYQLGELVLARHHLDEAVRIFKPEHRSSLFDITGVDLAAAALTWSAWNLLSLGYPDQARAAAGRALSEARTAGDPFTVALGLAVSGSAFRLLCHEHQAAAEGVEELAKLVAEKAVVPMQPWAAFLRGSSLTTGGKVEDGLAEMLRAADAWQTVGAPAGTVFFRVTLAEACLRHGHPEDAARALEGAAAVMDSTDERELEAEARRLEGEVALCRGREAEAESMFLLALEVSRRQEARTFELRAATSLARLWARLGKRPEARALLAPVYGWFTEGFDTPDLLEARKLLTAL